MPQVYQSNWLGNAIVGILFHN